MKCPSAKHVKENDKWQAMQSSNVICCLIMEISQSTFRQLSFAVQQKQKKAADADKSKISVSIKANCFSYQLITSARMRPQCQEPSNAIKSLNSRQMRWRVMNSFKVKQFFVVFFQFQKTHAEKSSVNPPFDGR